MNNSDYFLYLLRCGDGSLYTGIALDVDKRVAEHRDGTRGARYLRGRAPFDVVFRRRVGSRSTASRMEYRVKQLAKAQKEALVSGITTLAELFPQLDGAETTE